MPGEGVPSSDAEAAGAETDTVYIGAPGVLGLAGIAPMPIDRNALNDMLMALGANRFADEMLPEIEAIPETLQEHIDRFAADIEAALPGKAVIPPIPLPLDHPLSGTPATSGPNGEIVVTGKRQQTASEAWRTGGRMSPLQVERRAIHAMPMYYIHRKRGMSPQQAAGWAANAEGEGGADGYKARQKPRGPGRGLFQWGADNPKFDRRLDFQRLFGHPIEQSTEEEQLKFRDWELTHTEKVAAAKINRAQTAGDIAYTITTAYERPAAPIRDAIDRANIAEAIMRRIKAGH